jgi:hypothetical protein
LWVQKVFDRVAEVEFKVASGVVRVARLNRLFGLLTQFRDDGCLEELPTAFFVWLVINKALRKRG